MDLVWENKYFYFSDEGSKERIKLNCVSWDLYLQVFGYDKDSRACFHTNDISLSHTNSFPTDNGWKTGEVRNLKTSIFMYKGFDIT